jgi:peptidyl-prolyl cis-trans isomerase SurA
MNNMMMSNNVRSRITGFFAIFVLLGSGWANAQYLDRIVAVVEDDVILDSELTGEAMAIEQKLKASNVMVPPSFILRKQVLERLVIDKLQRLLAKRAGVRVSEEMLQSSITDIARQNRMSPKQFRQQLEQQGINYSEFVESIRNEIIINQLRAREIGSRIKVSDREIDHFMETQGKVGSDNVQYLLGHILISVPEAASSTQIQKAKAKADRLLTELRAGQNFNKLAISESDGGQALQGGSLGWRSLGQVPTLFVEDSRKMSIGDISEPIRSPSGFHIIKLMDAKGLLTDVHMVTETHVQHILIKTNELINDDEAKKRLRGLSERIDQGESFATLARANSDDPGSALKGGDLGWITPGALVKPFEETMNQLVVNEMSEPVQTQFGWHMIQVLGRKEKDNSEEHKKSQVKNAIRKRKIEEETELWLRRLRDEAYVDIRFNAL